MFDEHDVNSKLSIFNEVLQSTFSLHAPIKTIKIRNRPCPFVTKEIKKHMKTRDQRHRRCLQTRDPVDWENFKESRNTAKKILRDAEKTHFRGSPDEEKNPSSKEPYL